MIKSKRFYGFTLVETMIVVTILGILAPAIITSFSSNEYRDEQKINAAAQEIVTALRYSRSKATQGGNGISVEINTNTESLRVVDAATSNVLYHPVDKKLYILNFSSSSIFNGVDIVSVNGSSGITTITFNANGQPDVSGTIIISYTDYSKTIVVDDITGRVSI